MKPCDENLATQIEEGYLKLKPFRTQTTTTTTKVPSDDKAPAVAPQDKPKDPSDDKSTRSASPFRFPKTTAVETAKKEMVWKLLGDQHMGKYVVYTSPTTAWLLSDDLYGKMTASVLQTLTAGVHLGGARLLRGYVEQTKSKEKEKEAAETKSSSVIVKGDARDESADRAEEKEMEEDYDDSDKEDPTRYALEAKSTNPSQIDHLILCVHGIGQKLGERMEGVNFVHGIPHLEVF